MDELFDRAAERLDPPVSRRVHYLSYGVVRNLGQLQAFLRQKVKRPPRKRLEAVLLVSAFEWLDCDPSKRPQVVHHAVGATRDLLSQSEGRFVNAVLRSLPGNLAVDAGEERSLASLSTRYSHPGWMVRRWLGQFGEEGVLALLKWNQRIPRVYAWSPADPSALPEDWAPTRWERFYRVDQADWEQVETCLREGLAYIADPSTRLGVEQVKNGGFHAILDLCAAPGGKSIQLQSLLGSRGGILVSVDVPGKRFDQLKENLRRYRSPGIDQVHVAKDVLLLEADDLPGAEFDLVYLDVPCSNSGVLQRRPDVKWRQTPESIGQLTDLQRRLITAAARFVKPGGSLVYSTCSIGEEENGEVVAYFLGGPGRNFEKREEVRSLPWESGHDGAYVCRLDRTG